MINTDFLGTVRRASDTLQQANRLVDSRTEQLKLMDRLNGRPSRPIGKDIRTIERIALS